MHHKRTVQSRTNGLQWQFCKFHVNRHNQEANVKWPRIVDLSFPEDSNNNWQHYLAASRSTPSVEGFKIDGRQTIICWSQTLAWNLDLNPAKFYKTPSIFSSQRHIYWHVLLLWLLSAAWDSISIHSMNRWLIFTQNAENGLYQTTN